MPAISIEVFRADSRDAVIAPDTIALATIDEGPWRAILIEHGMTSGQHAVALAIPLGDGTVSVHQTSLLALLAAARGLAAMAEAQLGWQMPE